MNKNRYKLVFSEVRGLWVCVAEIAKSKCKSGRSQRPGKILGTVLWLICLFPQAGYAEMVVAPTAIKEHRPGLDTSANKTPVINITAPNGQGISHNEFSKFDVNMPGVILNNSRADTVSQIGGYVLGNLKISLWKRATRGSQSFRT